MNMHDETLATQKRLRALSSLGHLHLNEEKPFSPKRIFPSLVLGVFFIALMLALIAGVSVYSSISNSTAATNTARQGAGLIVNVVHANDAQGAIGVGQGPEGRSLVVTEKLDSGTYETRFYLYQGKVVQEYSIAGSAYTPENASEVIQSSKFDFSYKHGLLTVSTDQGTAETALRSIQGGN
ncbi:MAG: DUF4860 domain-containing protein [Coriobacteriia bacterium]|nr:DUF4860 domain-containing protein [Coriobacteriia bacterium]